MFRHIIASLRAVVGRARARHGETSAVPDDESAGAGESGSETPPRSSLFRCPDCATVYVAIEKEICRTCQTALRRVPSTLSEG